MSFDGPSIHRVGAGTPQPPRNPTGASIITSLGTRLGSVSHPASFRKTPRLPSVATAVGHNPALLLYAQDRYSGRRFLVDTGAEVSVFPATRSDRLSQTQRTAANGSSIHTYGTRTMSLTQNQRPPLQVEFYYCPSLSAAVGS